ncbi:cyclin-like protein [Vairimorpha apis BRL 01]|uniref:Cyclin-like protein n=1 Tax=Vairimorpha apis BRL 01 TaxID=1037528 RepID=T0L0I9_9MICR|nr:cyclin-like protein [Vairimorpha apis BRL 01]
MKFSDRMNISFLIDICKQIGCPQRIIQYVSFIYYKRCKIDNYFIDVEFLTKKIPHNDNISKEKVDEFELQICIEIDFNFNIQDVYKLIKELNVEKKLLKIIWIFINDSFYLPLRMKYNNEDILMSCLYLAEIINSSNIVEFGKINNDWNSNFQTVDAICKELLDLYEI